MKHLYTVTKLQARQTHTKEYYTEYKQTNKHRKTQNPIKKELHE
jgi:hypothetical protein